MTPKHQNMLDNMVRKITALYEADANMAIRVIDTATLTAKRLHGRLTVPEDAERVEFLQERGPTVEFTGRKMFGKERDGKVLELWTTLSGDWVLFSAWEGGSRVWTFEGDERTSQRVLEVTGYEDWIRPLVKGMGWDKHLEVD